MGKKGKKGKKGDRCTSAKMSTFSSSKYSDLPDAQKKTWHLCHMPKDQKKTWVLCDLPKDQKKTWVSCAELNFLDEYFKLLDWMSYWCCLEGFDFGGLKSLKCVTSYPLIELEIVYGENSRKLLISRASLYILAFYSPSYGWSAFEDDELNIDFGDNDKDMKNGKGKGKGKGVSATYGDNIDTNLSLQSMTKAFTDMEAVDGLTASNACKVFAVHLCEACRFKFIRLKVAQSIMPCVSTEEGDDLVLGSTECKDVLPFLWPIIIDFNLVDGDAQVVAFIKHFKLLSKAWMTYILSNKTVCPLEEKIADACGVKFVRTIRHSLSLLSNTNVKKILEEWEKKVGVVDNFTETELDFMKSMVSDFEKS